MDDIPLLEYWYRALRNPPGWKITTSDPNRLRTKLYKARTEANDEALAPLRLTIPAEGGAVWIIHRDLPNDS